MTKDPPIHAIVPGQKNDIIGFNDYYFLHKRILCTCAFSTSAVTSTIGDGASPTGSTEPNDKTGHNYLMPHILYTVLSVPLSLDSRQNPEQTLASKPPSATCFSKTLMPSSTTTLSATPYLPAKMESTNPSCSQVIVLIWLKYLHDSHSSWMELMHAPHTSSTCPGSQIVKLQLPSPHPPNHTTPLPRENHLCL
jgi:hypothetical protein